MNGLRYGGHGHFRETNPSAPRTSPGRAGGISPISPVLDLPSADYMYIYIIYIYIQVGPPR